MPRTKAAHKLQKAPAAASGSERLSPSFCKAILNSSTDSIVLLDRNHRVICCNDAIKEELHKYFHKTLSEGDDYRDFVVEAVRSIYLTSFEQALNGERIQIENRTVGNGVDLWYEYRMSPVYDEAGILAAVILSATNINNLKQREFALSESESHNRLQAARIDMSERYWRSLIESSTDAVVLMDTQGRVSYQTPSTERILGYTLEEIQSMDGMDLVYPDDRSREAQAFEALCKEPGQRSRRLLRVLRKDGSYIWIEASFRNMLEDPAVAAIVMNYTDVSEKIRYEARLKKMNRELQLLNNINDIIIHCSEEQDLYNQICDCIVREGDYRLAWVALPPEPGSNAQEVRVVTASGETSYLQDIRIVLNDPEHALGPTARVLTTGKTVVTNDVGGNPLFAPWIAQARQHGIHGSIVLPLKFEEGNIGCLNVYSGDVNAFDTHESAILERIAHNITLSVNSARSAREKARTRYLLNERVKELTIIYKVNELLQRQGEYNAGLFQNIIAMIPGGWEYPEICAARLTVGAEVYATENFRDTACGMRRDFQLNDGRPGSLEVCYVTAAAANLSFMPEEYALLEALSDTIAAFINRCIQQKALFQSEAYLRSSFEYAAIGKAFTAPDGRFFRVNRTLCDMLGYPADELIGKSYTEITHPDDNYSDEQNVASIWSGERDYFRAEKRYLRKDGAVIWVNLNTAVVRDESGIPLYFVSQMENITERKQAQEALSRSEANLRTVFNHTDVGYMLLDRNLTVLSFNQRFAQGIKDGAGVVLREGQSYIEQTIPERRELAQRNFLKVLESSEPLSYEAIFMFGEARHYFDIHIVPIMNGSDIIGLCVTAMDITEMKLRQLERQALIRDLVQRNTDLQQFAYIVSHNVRAPLSNILGLKALLHEQISQEDLRLVAQGMESSALRLDEVIHDLNEVLQARQETSEATCILDLQELMEVTIESLSEMIQACAARIRLDFSAINAVQSVRSHMIGICYNLLSNAIKFHREDVPPEILVRSRDLGMELAIEFVDNGKGIDLPADRDKLFLFYKRLDFSVAGRGMGLFMTKTRLDAIGGHIEVVSAPGEGSVFTVFLPK